MYRTVVAVLLMALATVVCAIDITPKGRTQSRGSESYRDWQVTKHDDGWAATSMEQGRNVRDRAALMFLCNYAGSSGLTLGLNVPKSIGELTRVGYLVDGKIIRG